MMNKETRRLSKIPLEVRGEIEPFFLDYDPVVEEDGRKLKKLDDDTADFIRSGLTVSYTTLNIYEYVIPYPDLFSYVY